MNVLIGAAIALSLATVFIPYIAGAVIARRAWKRNGWPETRLAFRAFVAGPALYIITAITLPLVGWLTDNYSDALDVIDVMYLLTAIAAAAQGAVTIAIAVALYRLARRSARPDVPASSRRANEIGRALS